MENENQEENKFARQGSPLDVIRRVEKAAKNPGPRRSEKPKPLITSEGKQDLTLKSPRQIRQEEHESKIAALGIQQMRGEISKEKRELPLTKKKPGSQVSS